MVQKKMTIKDGICYNEPNVKGGQHGSRCYNSNLCIDLFWVLLYFNSTANEEK